MSAKNRKLSFSVLHSFPWGLFFSFPLHQASAFQQRTFVWLQLRTCPPGLAELLSNRKKNAKSHPNHSALSWTLNDEGTKKKEKTNFAITTLKHCYAVQLATLAWNGDMIWSCPLQMMTMLGQVEYGWRAIKITICCHTVPCDSAHCWTLELGSFHCCGNVGDKKLIEYSSSWSSRPRWTQKCRNGTHNYPSLPFLDLASTASLLTLHSTFDGRK